MKYIALLRGVNVGGNNKIAMADLKSSFMKAGFKNVFTYINSGNIIFENEEKDINDLIRRCKETLFVEFGFPIDLSLISADDLKDSMKHAPEWWGKDPDSKHNAIFVIEPASAEDITQQAGQIKPEYEQLSYYNKMIFWSAPIKTFSRTRWSKIVGTKIYKYITIRNYNTAKKLLELSSSND